MIALELTDIKSFMNILLTTNTFDNFLLQEAVIQGNASFVIDGHLQKGFYNEEELETLHLTKDNILPFSMLKTNCYDLIKGKKTPSSFKFVFLLSHDNLENTLRSLSSSYTIQDLSGVFMNIKYQNQLLTLTTGISYRIFSTDKSLEQEWDRLVMKFLRQHEISYEEL